MKHSDHPRIYIVVDPSKLNRCKWCGTVESHDWITTENGTYCSKECKAAEFTDYSSCCISSLFMINIILTPSLFLVGVGGLGTLVLLWGFLFFFLYRHYTGKKYAKIVPRGSRRRKSSFKELLMDSSYSLTCPTCDGNLDLTKIGPDRIYKCEYCGASGIVEIKYKSEN